MEVFNEKEFGQKKLAKGLTEARKQLGLSRKELAKNLSLSPKSVEKFENGRINLDSQYITKVLKALNITTKEFSLVLSGKVLTYKKRETKVLELTDRRIYQKKMTKEVKILRNLRRMKNLTQTEAGELLGYRQTQICHIENGRIELPMERIRFIVKGYGFSMDIFKEMLNQKELRDEILEKCISKLNKLNDEKLQAISGMLENF